MGPCNLKRQLSSTVNPWGWGASGVVAGGRHGEGGLAASGIREMVVVSFPGASVVIEGEEPGEEQHSRPGLAAHADPVATQVQWQGWPGGQHRWMVLIRAGNEAAGQAGPSVVLPKLKQSGRSGTSRARLVTGMDSQGRTP